MIAAELTIHTSRFTTLRNTNIYEYTNRGTIAASFSINQPGTPAVIKGIRPNVSAVYKTAILQFVYSY